MAANQRGWFSSIFGSGNTLLPTTAPAPPSTGASRNSNRNRNARVVPVAPHPATMLTLPASRAGSPVPNVANGPLPNGRGSPAPPPAPPASSSSGASPAAAPAITNASGGKAPIVKNNTSANQIAVNVGGPSMVGGKRRTNRKKSKKSRKSKTSKSRK